jgi:spore germination protein GerM
MVPKTKQTAEATVRALIEGPGQYRDRVRLVIPDGTQLRGIRKAGTTIIVDFTQPFAAAADRAAAVRTIVESLTTLPGVSGVQFLVEGDSLGKQWGGDYGSVFGRRAINSEG